MGNMKCSHHIVYFLYQGWEFMAGQIWQSFKNENK